MTVGPSVPRCHGGGSLVHDGGRKRVPFNFNCSRGAGVVVNRKSSDPRLTVAPTEMGALERRVGGQPASGYPDGRSGGNSGPLFQEMMNIA